MLKKYIPRSEFAINVLTLMTGTTIAQAIPVAISPILTRLYTPADFGMLSLFMSFVAIIAVVIAARYEFAIMLPKDDNDARNILVLALIICTSVSILSLVIIGVFNEPLSRMMGNPKIGNWLYWAPLTLFFTGVYQAFNLWSTRKKTFRNNAISRVSMASAIGGTQLLAGTAGLGAVGLVTGTITGQAVGALVISSRVIKYVIRNKKEISVQRMKANMKRYKSFPMVNAPHALIDTVQEQGVVFLINYFFTSTILGFYAFALRLLLGPLGLIGSSMNQVFYQKASDTFNNGQSLRPLVRSMYRKLLTIGLPLFTVLFFILPWLFGFVFGAKWKPAGEIGQYLLPWIFLNFLISPVSSLPLIVGKQKQAMLFSFVNIILKAAAILTGGYYHDYKLTFILISVSGGAVYLAGMYWYYLIADTKQAAYVSPSEAD
jgi:O-antigen/teichoic acid export membrane protein